MCKILDAHEVKPHKVRYYLERRDPEFETKMAEVLCVCREVAILKQADATGEEASGAVAIVSYDEKPGVQAIGMTAPDLPPEPGVHRTLARDHEYKRHGTLSLLAGIDLLTGKVHALVKDRHRSASTRSSAPSGTAFQTVDMQLPAVDGARRQLSLIDCPSHAIQLVHEGFGAGVKPEATIHGHGQSRRGKRCSGNQGGLHFSVALAIGEPDIAGFERVPEFEQHCRLPQRPIQVSRL